MSEERPTLLEALILLDKERAKCAKLREHNIEYQRLYNEMAGAYSKQKRQLAEQYQLAQFYRVALQEIRDRTPANQHKEWPHHHWYLATATDAINHNMAALLQEKGE